MVAINNDKIKEIEELIAGLDNLDRVCKDGVRIVIERATDIVLKLKDDESRNKYFDDLEIYAGMYKVA